MYHYVTLICPDGSRLATDVATRARKSFLDPERGTWTCLMSSGDISVYARAPDDAGLLPYRLPGGAGVILGRLFERNDEATTVEEADIPAAAVADSRGQVLVDRYWGAYVAFLRTQNAGQLCVLRDCSGRIPCFQVEHDGAFIFFSDINDLAFLDLDFSVNDRYLASFIARQPLYVHETGLNGVTEIFAGERTIVSANRSSRCFVWNPCRFANCVIKSYPEARELLVCTTERVVYAWARHYKRILLCLSGGLDSAIVLGCLAKSGVAGRVVCITQFTAGTSDDERVYARGAARMAGVTLLELPRVSGSNAFLQGLMAIPADPRPDISKTARILSAPQLSGVADTLGCVSLWKGQGGDQIFLQSRCGYGAADHLLQQGLRHWKSEVYRSALLSGQSVWTVASQALNHLFRRQHPARLVLGGRGTRFLASSAPVPYPEEPIAAAWHRESNERLAPGKLLQLDMLFDVLNRHRPIVGYERPYEHHPLISQPLLDLAVRIPTYHLLRGGRQRGMAREAFSDRVPHAILRREDKGDIADQVRSLLRGGATEALLDGELASRGILDRKAIEGIAHHEQTFSKHEVFPLFACVAAEAWIQHWATRRRRAAAA